MPDKIYLRQMQALPLRAKVNMSHVRIREWYEHFDGDVCISFSGGKDSTVLASLVHEFYPNVPMVFCNTGLEYPEIQEFAKRMGAEFVRPKMRFDEVISKYGYPIISKENAEAIHYARKIKNSGSLDCVERERERERERVQACSSAEPDGEGQHSQGRFLVVRQKQREIMGLPRISVGGGMTDTHRKRSNLQNLRKEYNQAREHGTNGEETPLPG